MRLTDWNMTRLEWMAIYVAGCQGEDCNNASDAEAMKDDNMTWFTAADLMKANGWTKEQTGGVMASLQAKGFASDSGEAMIDGRSTTKAGWTDWTLDDAGIDAYYQAGEYFDGKGNWIGPVANENGITNL